MTTLPFVDSVKAGLLASGWYANRLGHDAFPGVLTLCYHGIRRSSTDVDGIPFANLHVDADTFDAHCRVIAETCHPIDLAAFREARVAGRALPARPVLVTFDDGYRSVFELARPILHRYKIPAAVYVCSEPVRDQQLFWFDAVARSLGPDAVQALRATASHAPLANASAIVQRGELESCRLALEAWTGQRPDTLAYPFGAPASDYTAETVAIAADLGFETAFTTRNDFARSTEPPLERSRFVMLAAVTAAELAHRIAYAWPR